MKKKVDIFWTGGFDSSFRVIQLSMLDVLIQPIYISDNRKSEANELQAIKTITKKIEKRTTTKATILPLIYKKKSDISEDKDITKSFYTIQKKYNLGGQYEWLARFAKEYGSPIELGLEKEQGSHAYQCLSESILQKKEYFSNNEYYILAKEEEINDFDLYVVFSNFRFPLPLFEMTKLEVLEWSKISGFVDIIKNTWFCHTPIKNESCGLCNPCKQVVDAGMSFRLSRRARLRYFLFKSNILGRLILQCFNKINVFLSKR